ncbi:MAG: AraC family transcriptional regulator [Cyclobacteriaceae bacterium]
MTLLEQFYSYKNGLEITITFFAGAQAIYLISRRGSRNVALIQGTIFLLLAIHFLFLTLRNTFNIEGFDAFQSLLFISYGPISYLMVNTLVYQHSSVKKEVVFLVFSLALVLLYLSTTTFTSFNLGEYFWNISFTSYGIYLTFKHPHTITPNQKAWLLQFLWGFTIAFSIYPIVHVSLLYFPDSYLSFKIPFTTFFLCFVINNFRHVLMKPQVLNFSKLASNRLMQGEPDAVISAIRTKMKNAEPYLDPHLDLKNFSRHLGYSERQISEAINRGYRQNFSQFINDYRLEKAVQIMKEDGEHLKLVKEIMYISGFSNKVSFISAFKSKYGLTPSNFRKSLLAPTAIKEAQD